MGVCMPKYHCPHCGKILDGISLVYSWKWPCSKCAEDQKDVLYCERGTKVKAIHLNAGWPGDQERAHKLLSEGAVYEVESKFYLSLLQEKKLSPNTIEGVNTVLHPVFTLAVRDGYIRTNPSQGVLSEMKKKYDWGKPKRHALTEGQQAAFIDYVRNSTTYRHYLNLFTVFLGTGCRVGEITGLRWEDCDFTEGVISINHNLVYCKTDDGRHRKFFISTPKTAAGKRVIPMLSEVRRALMDERLQQMKTGFCQVEIDGYSGFVFMGAKGNVRKAIDINKAIVRIITDYNKEETELALKQHREPELLPHFSVHNLRHTFCTRLCEHETNLKVIQEVMGHANISITMDVYNEVTQKQKKASFANLEGKIKIS